MAVRRTFPSNVVIVDCAQQTGCGQGTTTRVTEQQGDATMIMTGLWTIRDHPMTMKMQSHPLCHLLLVCLLVLLAEG